MKGEDPHVSRLGLPPKPAAQATGCFTPGDLLSGVPEDLVLTEPAPPCRSGCAGHAESGTCAALSLLAKRRRGIRSLWALG